MSTLHTGRRSHEPVPNGRILPAGGGPRGGTWNTHRLRKELRLASRARNSDAIALCPRATASRVDNGTRFAEVGRKRFPSSCVYGFTLVEILVSIAIFILLMLILVSITSATQKTWSYTAGKVEQFREAREAFESLTRRLSQATLNTYWDYDDPLKPSKYLRQSELRFICGPGLAGTDSSSPQRPTHSIFFQAPLGFVSDTAYRSLENLLNTWGYYVEFGEDSQSRPSFISSAARHRFRLMELMEPSDKLTLYKKTSGDSRYVGTDWFTTPLESADIPKRPIAENVIALVILPKLSSSDQQAGGYSDGSLAPAYLYDSTVTNADKTLNSKNQLPPVLQVTMVAVDEASFDRAQTGSMAPDLGLGSLFQSVGDTIDPTKPGFARDLRTLEVTLREKKLNYRIFTTNVSIKAAKWSREQAN